MVDQAKRNTLIMLSGTALVTAMPAIAAGYGNVIQIADAGITHDTPESMIAISGKDMEMSIELNINDQPTVTIANLTDQLIIVRHVYPGIVHAGERTFDINSVFERSAYAVSAGKSRTIAISETYSTQAEVKFPRDTHQPIRAAKLIAQTPTGLVANSTRSFYA